MAKNKQKKTYKQQQVPVKSPLSVPGAKIDYKDVYNLRKKFITTRGYILPASKTGVTHQQQRKLKKAIKRARYLGLLPYTNYT